MCILVVLCIAVESKKLYHVNIVKKSRLFYDEYDWRSLDMRKRTVKALSTVVLVCLLSAGCLGMLTVTASPVSGTVTYAEKADVPNDVYWPYFDAWNADKEYQTFAIRFSAKSSFTGVYLMPYVEGTPTVGAALYAWDTDYATSVAGTARAEVSFVPELANPNERNDIAYHFDSAQAAGEYVAVFTVQGTQAFIPTKAKRDTSMAECYVAGNLIDVDFYGGLIFEDASADTFNPLGIVTWADKANQIDGSNANADLFWPYFDTWNAGNQQSWPDFAIHFSAGAPFTGLYLASYAEGSPEISVKLYAWSKDYETTVKGSAQVAATIQPEIQYNGDRNDLSFPLSDGLPAGEYLAVFTVKSASPLIPTKTKAASAYVECYMDANPIDVDFFGGLIFAGNADDLYLPVEKETVPFFETSKAAENETAIAIGDEYGIQFATAAPFNKLSMVCPTWTKTDTSMSWSLYQWAGSYEDSVAQPAIAAVEHLNIADGATLTLNLEQDAAAGEYLLVIKKISEGADSPGIYGFTGTSEYTRSYVNGEIYYDASPCLYVHCAPAENYYGKISVSNGTTEIPSTGDGSISLAILAAAVCLTSAAAVRRKRA